MLYVPAGLLRDQIEFKPKVEIWAGSRPSWSIQPESLVSLFDDNGTEERISTSLENLISEPKHVLYQGNSLPSKFKNRPVSLIFVV